jgi:outer membrane protein OmpA-like peptidoglycan-associated protein
MQNSNDPVSGGEVIDRVDPPRSFLGTAWPLVALALLLLMLMRACVPSAPVSAPVTAPVAFDSAAAARQANDAALESLRALPPEPTIEQALAALNGIVVNFASNSDAVPPEATELLKSAAIVIAGLPPETRILVTGHTDNVGDAAANLVLSRRRAQAVRAVLVGHGAPATVLSAHGLGDSRPVADNGSETGRFRNRRIEFSAAR